tara:strand:- start:63 stop:539 length:477 start_codon:yes stop_codon:yes gene_type:complete
MNAKNSASIIKQYVKKNFPELTVWSNSKTYSGGSSVDVNVCNADGSSVDDSIYEQIESFSKSFKGGNFNGMIDMYEYNEDDKYTDNGTELKYFPSYVFVKNAPKWGSVEYWINSWNEESQAVNQVWSTIEGFLSHNKTYMTDKEYVKVEKAFQNLTIS